MAEAADVKSEDESAPSEVGAVPALKRRRSSYSVSRKLEVLQMLKNDGGNVSIVARKTGVDRSVIIRWRQAEEKLVGEKMKRDKRKLGSGRKAAFPQLESQLIEWFKYRRLKEKKVVQYEDVRIQARRLGDQLGITAEQFKISNQWIRRFCGRHNLGSRTITHTGQDDLRSPTDIKRSVVQFFDDLRLKGTGLSDAEIFNMDETPVYFDMIPTRTLHFRGDKNVDSNSSGHQKDRLTVVVAAAASGRMLKSMVILKGLKKVPKVKVPANLSVHVSPGGSMTSGLMKEWVKSCFRNRGPFLARQKSLLLLDSYGSHLREDVVQFIKTDVNTACLAIPPKTTSYLQPIDVGINGPFKAAMKRGWMQWFDEGPIEYTAGHNRKRPSWQKLFDMISTALQAVSSETIQRAFNCCGVAADGATVEQDRLNGRLKAVLEVQLQGIQDPAQMADIFGLESEAEESESGDDDEAVNGGEEGDAAAASSSDT